MAGLHAHHKHAILFTGSGVGIDTYESAKELAKAAIWRAQHEVGPANVAAWLRNIADEFEAEYPREPK